MTPSFVDKYYGKTAAAVSDRATGGSSSFFSGVESGEKDSDTVGRFNENFSVQVYLGDVVAANLVAPANGGYIVTNNTEGSVATTVTVKCTVTVSEPLKGLPTATLKEDESNYLGINNLELLLQWNDMRNVFNIGGSNTIWKSYAGDNVTGLVISDAAKLN